MKNSMTGEIKYNKNKEAFEWLDSVIFAFLIAAVLFGFVLQKAIVDGSSMNPTLYDTEKLLTYKFFYQPKKGDVVVVEPNNYKPLVKRVIGTPKDTIEFNFETSEIKVNGEILDEPYINEPTKVNGNLNLQDKIVLGENEYFVMGDNRNNSLDSRFSTIGILSKEEITGKVILRYGPFNKFAIIK